MLSTIIVVLSGLIGGATSAPDVVQVGTLRLCHPTVKSASIGSDQYTGEPTLAIILDEQAKATFAHLTRQAINSFLPVPLNGEIVANPLIQLEITRGKFQISGPKRPVLERIKSAMSSDC